MNGKLAGKIAEISLWSLILAIPFSKAFVHASAAVASFAFLAEIALTRRWRTLREGINLPMLIFLFAILLSVAHSTIFNVSLRAFFFKTLQYVFIYFAVIGTLKDWRRMKRFMFVLCLLGILVGADALFQHFTGRDVLSSPRWAGSQRVTGPLGNPITLALWALLQAPIWLSAVIFFKGKTGGFSKALAAVCAALLTFCVALSYSRGAWIALASAVIFMIAARWFMEDRQKKGLFSYAWAAAIFPLAVFAGAGLKTSAASLRLEMWAKTLTMIKRWPVLGSGLNTYMANYVGSFGTTNLDSVSAHNSYLELAAEAGVAGLAAFLFFVFIFFKDSILDLKTAFSQRRDGLYFWFLLGSMAGIAGFLAQNVVESALHNFVLAIFFWVILGMTASLRKLICCAD